MFVNNVNWVWVFWQNEEKKRARRIERTEFSIVMDVLFHLFSFLCNAENIQFSCVLLFTRSYIIIKWIGRQMINRTPWDTRNKNALPRNNKNAKNYNRHKLSVFSLSLHFLITFRFVLFLALLYIVFSIFSVQAQARALTVLFMWPTMNLLVHVGSVLLFRKSHINVYKFQN